MVTENFIKIYEKGFKENWERPALTDYNTKRIIYLSTNCGRNR